MKLTVYAAVEVCKIAASRGLLVGRVEGGIWHSPGFEARLDCIWDGQVYPPADSIAAVENNIRAVKFIESESTCHDVFIITAVPMNRTIDEFSVNEY